MLLFVCLLLLFVGGLGGGLPFVLDFYKGGCLSLCVQVCGDKTEGIAPAPLHDEGMQRGRGVTIKQGISVCTYVRMYVCTYVRMYVCTYVRIYVRMYVYMYICTYVLRIFCGPFILSTSHLAGVFLGTQGRAVLNLVHFDNRQVQY